MPSPTTAVKTEISTATKIGVAITTIFLLGMAAYGFGFIPMSWNVSPKPVPTPTTTQTSCHFSVKQVSPRSSGIIIGGGTGWTWFDEYKVTATDDDTSVTRVGVYTPSDSANFAEVAVAREGRVLGRGVIAAGASSANVDIGSVMIPRGTTVVFQIWGRAASVVSSASVGGATRGVARSGNAMALGVLAEQTDGVWGAGYRGSYNVAATCGKDARIAYASDPGSSTYGPQFFLRKTSVMVAPQALSSTTLANGDMDLAKVQVSADAAASAALKKMTFTFSLTRGASSTLALSTFRLRRGTTALPASSYQILDQDGNDLTAGTLRASVTRGAIVVVLTGEETISGSGNMYTLSGRIANAVSGDRLSLSLPTEVLAGSVTGYLTKTGAGTALSGEPGPNLDQNEPADGLPDLSPAFFIWSDVSEVPHAPTIGTGGGSRDWIPGTFVVPTYTYAFTR